MQVNCTIRQNSFFLDLSAAALANSSEGSKNKNKQNGNNKIEFKNKIVQLFNMDNYTLTYFI
jgi:hypothetical protein